MSITAQLQQIPLSVLEKIQENPRLLKSLIPLIESENYENNFEDFRPLLDDLTVDFEENDTLILDL